ITPLSPALSWARHADRIAFSYFEEAGYNIYTIDEPRRLFVAPSSPARLETAASQVGTPRLVEGPDAAQAATNSDSIPSSFYRTPEGFRRSGFEPGMIDDPISTLAVTERPEPQRTLSVSALRDSAGLALPDTASFTFHDYKPTLSPEIVGRPTIGAATGGFFGGGVYGGSFITLGDMLGNHSVLLAADIRGTFDNAVILASYAFLKTRTNFGISFQAYPFFRFLGRRFGPIPGEDGLEGDFDLFRRDRYRGVSFDASRPFSIFSRLEFGINAATIQSDLVYRTVRRADAGGFSTVVKGPSDAFIQPTMTYVFDNALDGFTGGIAGSRVRIGGGPTFGDLNMLDVYGDIRNYVPLPGPAVFATRLLSFNRFSLNSDNDARRYELTWGGPYYLRGYEIGSFGDAECQASQTPAEPDIFCPATEELIGSSSLLLNSELRFPILNPLMQDWLPLNFPPIDGALWFDVGMAFTPGRNILVLNREPNQSRVIYREPLTAYGASLRVNLFYAIVRVDYARVPSRGPYGTGVFSLAFGAMF
ncbi:MAG: BamA/TamA family outer membrane protein, partial [Gemmatimonadales bacterium]